MTSTIPRYTANTFTTDGAVTNTSPLHFDLNTNPDPVRISPSNGDTQRADFVLVGSRRSASAIECRKITLTVPTGNNSPDLTTDLTSAAAQISLPDWTPETNTATKTITFTPTSGHAEIGRDQGVTVQLMGMRINTEIGSAPLRMDLEWREAGHNDPWQTGTTIFDIGKFPPNFHLANFIAEPLIIDNNGAVELDWEASGVSSLRLLYDAADINVLNLTTYPVNNVTHTTVFYLRATVQVGNNTVERTLTTTVTVRIPDLEVGNLRVHGDFTIASRLPMVTVTPQLGVDERHPLKNLLNENLETYYLSNAPVQADDRVELDLHAPAEINTIDVYFGDPDGGNLPPSGAMWIFILGIWIRVAEIVPGQRELHWTPTTRLLAQFIRLTFVETSTTNLAIRSMRVSPYPWPKLEVTPDGALFDVPVTARRGITEV
ncbi:hypothetical protein [Nocardia sp. NPDC051463]|uniref:hypothetical protein n=1 Tax=Nocardia sp. NPDC051463 TaxID=3154845 RepID=UPI00344E2527